MMNRNWHENIRNKKSQVNSTDLQEDSMMIMLKPNVTNWIMLHQRDFNFQVHKVTFFQVMDHNLCSDSSKNLYRSLSLHEICENNNHKRRSTRWRCPRETFTWNFLTTRNHIYNGKTSLWLVTKKLFVVIKKLNHCKTTTTQLLSDTTREARSSRRSLQLWSGVSFIFTGKCWNKRLKPQSAQLVSNQHPSTPSFEPDCVKIKGDCKIIW